MSIEAVIIDDEAIARDVLCGYLERYCPTVKLIGQASDIREAIPLIKEKSPRLVFLDVEMPYGNAFDVLEACAGMSLETIFITAYAEYSIRALNMSAAYYILKPIDISELIRAVAKVEESLREKESLNRNRVLLENIRLQPAHQQIVLPTMQGFDVVKTNDIVRLHAKGNFTELVMADHSKKLICKFLKYFDDLLTAPFVRVHRSSIVHTGYIKSYHKGTGGYLTMSDGTEVEVSSSYKDQLLKSLGAGI